MPLSATQEEISAYQEKVQKNIFLHPGAVVRTFGKPGKNPCLSMR